MGQLVRCHKNKKGLECSHDNGRQILWQKNRAQNVACFNAGFFTVFFEQLSRSFGAS
jgi:hypothetical protein